MKEFVVTAVFTVFFTLVAVSLPSLCRLSAVAVTALSRLIIQNPVLLNDNHRFGADYSTAFCLF